MIRQCGPRLSEYFTLRLPDRANEQLTKYLKGQLNVFFFKFAYSDNLHSHISHQRLLFRDPGGSELDYFLKQM